MQVALRMKSKGGNARAGDVIPYVFCLSDGEETAKTAQADRAKHPDEVRRAGAELKIGTMSASNFMNICEANHCVRLSVLPVTASASAYRAIV